MAGIDFIHQNGVDYEIVPEIAPRFKTTINYAAGDCVIYNAEAYRFKTAHSAGAWIGTDAEKFLVGEELGAIKEDLNALDERVSELEAGGSGGLSMTAVNLLTTILNEAVYGTDQTTNIDLLYKELAKVRPVSITAELTSRALVGLAYSDLEFEITATFDDESTITTDEGYRVLTSGNVVSGSNTVTVSFRGVTTTVTFTAEQVTTYTITNNLTNVSTSNDTTVVVEDDRYATEITVETGYEVGVFTVTMGGVDVTDTVRNGNNIVIDEVTGNVVITVTASLPVYLDPLIRRRNGFDSVVYLCADNHVATPSRINNSFSPMISEYPAKYDCEITYRIENNTEEAVSVESLGFALLSGADATWVSNNEYPYYSAFAIPVGGNLAPGEYIEGTYTWKAGYQLVCTTTTGNIDKLDIKLRGNYVPIKYDEDDSYDRYVFNIESENVFHTYATQIDWYADDGTTSLVSKKTTTIKKITDSLPSGTYDLVFRLRNHAAASNGMQSYDFFAGTVDELTSSTASIYNSFSAGRTNIENTWMYKRVTVAQGNNVLVPSTTDLSRFGVDDSCFELYFKEVSA